MQTKLICNQCLKEVIIRGSKSQPIVSCAIHGVLLDNDIISLKLCKICNNWVASLEGDIDFDKDGLFFKCNKHKK